MAILQPRPGALAGLVVLGIVALSVSTQAAPDGAFVFSGWNHNCVGKANGSVYCWSSSSGGYSASDAVAGSGSAGFSHSCVVKANRNVDCWGSNTYGQAQDYNALDPTQSATQASAGGFHTCVLKLDKNVDCYGYNANGQSNDYAGGDAIFVSAGTFISCVVKLDHNPHCWGAWDPWSWYTDGDVASIHLAKPNDDSYSCLRKINGSVACNMGWTFWNTLKVDVGGYHACVLYANKTVECRMDPWDEDYGQAADDWSGDAVDVSTGEYHTCVLKVNGTADCYGRNNGYGDYRVPPAPTGVSAAAGPSAGRITLTWDAVTGVQPAVSYQVWRGTTSGGPKTMVGSGGCAGRITGTTCTDSGLGDAATRYYEVRAVNDLGDGPFSPEVSATTSVSSAPRNFRYDMVQDLLLWDPPAGSEAPTYRMYVRIEPHFICYPGPARPPAICTATPEHEVSGGGCANLGASTSCKPTDCGSVQYRCYYRVSAVNAAGQPGPKSDEVMVLPNGPL